MKIVITDWNFPNINIERKIIEGAGHTLVDAQCKTEDEVTAIVKDAAIVITQWAPVKAKAIAAMQNCKGIIRYGIGLDNIDLDAAKNKNIPVANIPDYCLNEVADHTMALLLAAQRQIIPIWEKVRKGEWQITAPKNLPPLRMSILGLIGFGRIAQRVALRAQAFGMKVLAYDPMIKKNKFTSFNVEPVHINDIWEKSDIISLHCPLLNETHHLISKSVFNKMKHNAILINTSRGGLINTHDLIVALNNNRIAGVALDVVEEEPLQPGHPLLTAENVVLTSHTAWYSANSILELQKLAAIKAIELLENNIN